MCSITPREPQQVDIKKLIARQSSLKDLSPFYGDSEQWHNFIAEYQSANELFSLSDVENMDRLRKCLRGRAKDAVYSLLVVPANVSQVIEILEFSFGRPEQIVAALIQKAQKIQNPREDRPESLMDFSNAVLNMVTTMESLKRTGHLLNPQLLSDLVNKLPIFAKVQWAQHVSVKEEELSLKVFSSWLQLFSRAMSRVEVIKMADERKFEVTQCHHRGHHRVHNV